MNRHVDVDRIVYATITLMSVLVIYDGWSSLKLLQLAGVVVGPVFAMFLGHSFSAAMARQVDEGRALTNSERIAILRSEAPFLLLRVPPIVLSVVLHLLGVSLTATINIVVWVGIASLGFWGGVAARCARLVGWRFASAVLAGLLSVGSSWYYRSLSNPEACSSSRIGATPLFTLSPVVRRIHSRPPRRSGRNSIADAVR
jgi:hypothetical protein